MHFEKIEEYSFDHGLHFNNLTGEYHSLNPHDLGRPLTHEEMDYNLIYQKQTLNGWRIAGSNADLTLNSDDLNKVLKYHQVSSTDTDWPRYSAAGLFDGQLVWIPVEISVGTAPTTTTTTIDPCTGFEFINASTTPSLAYEGSTTTTEAPTTTTEAPTTTTEAPTTTTVQQMGPALILHNTQNYDSPSSFWDYNAVDSNGNYVHDDCAVVSSYENPSLGNMTGGVVTYIRSQQNGLNLQIGDTMEWWNPVNNTWGLISEWGMGPDRRGVYEDTTGTLSGANENWIIVIENGILVQLTPFSTACITTTTSTTTTEAPTSTLNLRSS